MLNFLFRKRNLKRELETVREGIDLKKAEVEACEREGRKAWGKKWSYIQMHRRGHEAGELFPGTVSPDGHGEAFEIRFRQAKVELKAREKELADLIDRERALAAELGVESSLPLEASGEER